MSANAVLAPPPEENRRLGDDAVSAARKVGIGMVVIGLALTGVAALWHHERFWAAYLVGFTYLLSITLGGLFFVIIQHLVRAGWSVTVRRVAEAVAMNFKVLPFLFLPLIYGIGWGGLLPKADLHAGEHHVAAADHGEAGGHGAPAAGHGAEVAAPGHPGGDWVSGPHLPDVAHAAMDPAKETWLSFPWLMTRMAIFFVLWFLIARFYHSNSVKQDETGDPALTAKMQFWSAPSVVVFGITASLAGFDLLMALDPYWYSTIFGVYYFAGGFLGFFAALILTLHLLQRSGRITHSVTPEHYHDVGKFMFAFVVFWAYIGFSQYMLIWYANIPEETGWYLIRQTGDWVSVSVFLILGHFVLPFLLLISRFPKRRPGLVALGACYMLVVHWVDLFWVVVPQKSPLGVFPAPVLDVFLMVALAGIYVLATVSNLKGAELIPVRDPRLVESLNHENY